MRQIVIISAVILSIGLLTGIAIPGNDPHCKPTNDLSISGGIVHYDKGDAALSGTIVNSSAKQEYENVLIGATFYDAGNEAVGHMEFTIKDDVEANEKEEFYVRLKSADNVVSVKYNIKCAEYN